MTAPVTAPAPDLVDVLRDADQQLTFCTSGVHPVRSFYTDCGHQACRRLFLDDDARHTRMADQ
jgi:hypothetical protein